jgi:hypothetical protein
MKILTSAFFLVVLFSTTYAQTYTSPTAWLEIDAEEPRLGDTLRVSLKAFVDQPLVSWQMYLDWNPDVFAYRGAVYNTSALPNFTTQNFADPNEFMEENAQASISWFDNTFAGVDTDSGAVIIDIFLEAIDCGVDTLKIINEGFLQTEILSTGENGIFQLDITEIDRPVDISCDTTDILLYVQDETLMQEDTVCIPVLVDHYEEVSGFQFPLSYDPAALELIEFRNFTPDLPQFGESAIGPLLPGGSFSNHRVLYFDPQLSTQTLPNNSVLFEACFTPVNEMANCTSIGFRDVSEGLELTEFVDVEGATLRYEIDPARIRVAGILRDTLCEGESLTVNGQQFDKDRPAGIAFLADPVCDSLPLEVLLHFLPADTTMLNIEIFTGEAYQVGNETFNEAGDYEILLNNQFGCDSLILLRLDILTATEEATSTLSLDEWSLQQLLDDAPTRFPENELRLFDALGRQVYIAQPYQGHALDFSRWPSGIYYYTFRPSIREQKIVQGKLLITQ